MNNNNNKDKINIKSIKIISQNLQRVRLNNIDIGNYLNKYDILLCQETTLPTDKNFANKLVQDLERQYNCKINYSTLENGTCLTTITKNDFSQYKKSFKELIPGRATSLEIENKEHHYNIINIYGPASSTVKHKQEFCEHLFKKLEQMRNCILIGDWNILLKEEMSNRGLNKYHKETSKRVSHLFENWIEIHDIIRTKLNYTFNANLYKARLDRIYIKANTHHKILNYEIIPTAHSDHKQIYLAIKWGNIPKWGRGIWKMNSNILKDNEFIEELNRYYMYTGVRSAYTIVWKLGTISNMWYDAQLKK